MKQNDEWESTKGSGNIWNPTKDSDGEPKLVAEENDYLDGYYVSKKEGVGQHNASVYTIQTKDGDRMDVWGTTALNQEMDKIRNGQFIRIKWLGKLPTKAGQLKPASKRGTTDSYHAWEVFVNNKVAPLGSSPAPVAQTAVAATKVEDESELPF